MNPKLLAPVILATALLSCGPDPGSSPEASQPSTEEINTQLTEILGTGLPKAATNVTVSQSNLSAKVFDCGFICTQADLDAMIAASPRLSAARDAAGDAASDEPDGGYYLSTSWNATGRKGAQFVMIKLSSVGEKSIAVDIGTTFIPGVKLAQ